VDEQRPRWQWVAFGGLAILVAWLPLAVIVGTLAARIATAPEDAHGSVGRAAAAIVAMHAVALGLASLAGGLLVGRWGGAGVGVRDAALAGVVASLIAIAGAWVSAGPSPGFLAVLAISVSMAALGGAWGRRGRARRAG
jgi:hypothetical protein